MTYWNFNKDYSVFIVPTGIGASIGGFAGDAGYYAKKIAEEYPLIVNPNVVNAACFSAVSDNMLYCEGSSITDFFKGKLFFEKTQHNKIGIIFDNSISQELINIHINTINAVKTVYGTDIIGFRITKEPVGVDFFLTDNGISSGLVKNIETLSEAGYELIEEGATALAVVCKFDEPEQDGYANGEAVDIVGGAEAIISHYLTRKLKVQTVHAPAFEDYSIKSDIVNPKAAAEYITPTFLPCLLLGLEKAPKIVTRQTKKCLSVKNIKSLIIPHNCLGSSIVSDALKFNIPIIAVKENKTYLDVNRFNLSLKSVIIEVDSYKNCIEVLKGIYSE